MGRDRLFIQSEQLFFVILQPISEICFPLREVFFISTFILLEILYPY